MASVTVQAYLLRVNNNRNIILLEIDKMHLHFIYTTVQIRAVKTDIHKATALILNLPEAKLNFVWKLSMTLSKLQSTYPPTFTSMESTRM